MFIFDGFDEIREDKRKTVEKEIAELSKLSPENLILITSRPDELFQSWQDYWCYQVQKLNKNQVVALLDKVSFNLTIKKKFIERVKKDLFEKHESLLSTPLLATIMLLTFNAFADIPNKIHVFYEQAFETLFARHDAFKDAFKRQFSTNLPIDVFKNQFSAFCLITYDKEIYSFSEAQILEFIGKSKTITGLEFDNSQFLRDLLESVCMLQRDGLSIVFSHRSFQEFFAARCLNRMPRERVAKLLPKYFNRFSDSTGGMLFDMNNDLVEECYLIPTYTRLKNQLKKMGASSGIEKTCLNLKCAATISIYKKMREDKKVEDDVSIRFDDRVLTTFTSLISDLFQVDLRAESNNFSDFYERDRKAAEKVLKQKDILSKLKGKNGTFRSEIFSSEWKVEPDVAKVLETYYRNSGYMVFRKLVAKRTLALCELMIKKSLSRNSSIDELLLVP